MVLPFWRKANAGIAAREKFPHNGTNRLEEEIDGDWEETIDDLNDYSNDSPNCLLIGAGGCSLAHTMTVNFRSNSNSHAYADKTKQQPLLTAVEACPEILCASQLWFGAGNGKEDGNGLEAAVIKLSPPGPPPAFFDLVCDTGQSYLESLVRECGDDELRSKYKQSMVDVLVIDAEDGSAPPKSMRTSDFWADTVLPALNFTTAALPFGGCGGPVVGVNVIGSESEIARLMDTMRKAFANSEHSNTHTYSVLAVSPPPEAEVSNRHRLVFALPTSDNDSDSDDDVLTSPTDRRGRFLLTEDELRDCVDVPWAWEQQVRVAFEESTTV